MDIAFHLDVAPFLEPLLAFAQHYGLMVLGAMIVMTAFGGRKLGPLGLIILLLGLGVVIAGASHLALPVLGK